MQDAPPAFIPLRAAVINNKSMPAALFQTYARLYAAAWQHAYQHTGPLHFEAELLPLLGVRRSQARQQLRLLRFAGLLDWTTDAHNHYVIHFPAPPPSEKADCVVVESIHSITNTSQQQQPESGKTAGPARGEDGLEDDYTLALGYLERAGVWADVARRIAAQIAGASGEAEAETPTLADVLGWIAYCFGDRAKNKIGFPAAVLAANLNARRRSPEEYRPQPVCAGCLYEVDYCECEGEPQPHFPAGYLERAFRPKYSDNTHDIWGICQVCHAYPCRCD
jgi:hypothetical protein